MKPAFLALIAALSAACSRMERDAHDVFEHAFGPGTPPPGVTVVNGLLYQNRHLIVFYEESWSLQINGPNAMDFVRHRWPDLMPGAPDIMVMSDLTPWFPRGAGGEDYSTYVSPSDDAVFVLERKSSPDVFISHLAL